MRRAVRCSGIAVAVSAALAPPALARTEPEVQLSASTEPTEVRLGTTRHVTYRLTIVTGSEPAHLSVVLLSPSFVGTDWVTALHALARLAPLGSPVAPAGALRLEGPGELNYVALRPPFLPPVPGLPTFPCERGAPVSLRPVLLTIPPDSQAALVARYRLVEVPMWPMTNLAATFKVRELDEKRRRRGRSWSIRSRAVRPIGPTGVQILHPVPEHPYFLTAIRRGQRAVVSGGTSPMLVRQKLVLRFRALTVTGDWGPTKTLARLRTSDKGGFRYAWHPAFRTTYQVWAVYPRQRRRLLSDESCPIYINVL